MNARPAGLTTTSIFGIAAAAALVPLNSTMIAVALPTLADELDVATGTTSLLVTAYLVVMLVGQPLSGRLVDVVGAQRLVSLALAGFAASSVVAALAETFAVLLVARVAQAVFGSALSPGVQAMLRSGSAPSQRGRSFGLLGSVIGVGAAAGPLIGGLLIDGFGWEAIFWVNVPVVALAYAGIVSVGPAAPEREDRRAEASQDVIWNPVYRAAFAAQALATFGQYTLLLLVPVVLAANGWGSGSSGAALSALTVGMIVMGPAGGRIGDRRGRRQPATVGLALASASLVVLVVSGADVAPAALILAIGAFGLGTGFAVPSLMTAGLESVGDHRAGSAAGLFSTARYVGSIPASVAVGALVSDTAEGSRALGALALGFLALATLAATRLPSRAAAADREGLVDHGR